MLEQQIFSLYFFILLGGQVSVCVYVRRLNFARRCSEFFFFWLFRPRVRNTFLSTKIIARLIWADESYIKDGEVRGKVGGCLLESYCLQYCV